MQKGSQQKIALNKLEKLNINSQDVEYNQKYFKDEDDGMFFQKKILKEKNQKGQTVFKISVQIQNQHHQQLDLQKLDPQMIWQKIDKIQIKSPCLARILCHQIMNKPVTENQRQTSYNIRADLINKIQHNPDCIQNIVLKITQELEYGGMSVILQQKSSLSSQITAKNFVGGVLTDTVKVIETIENKEQTCPFTFEELQQSSYEFEKFQAWYKNKIEKQTGLDSKNIVIHSVEKGSIKVEWSTNQTNQLYAAVKKQSQIQKKLKLHRFFQSYRLSPQDFDPRGNFKFFETKKHVQFRGGWPYYQPVKCKRYGLKVSKKFDRGDDTWLQMKGKPGEWAVGFHGVSMPSYKTQSGKLVLNSIMQGKQADQMLKAGKRQAYSNTFSINHPNQKVGYGVYLSPHIQIPLKFYSSKTDEYSLVFQCRINPKKVKVCSNNTYWVVNDSKDIRPYGVILVKKENMQAYPSIEEQFNEKFVYNDYKQKIESYLNSF